MPRVRVFNPSQIPPERAGHITVPAGSVITIHPSAERGEEQIKPMTRRTYMQRKVNPKTNPRQATNPAVFLKREDNLRKENERLKKKIEGFQDRLDEIADVASADDSTEDEDQLKEKLNTVLDLAAPGSADEDEEDEDEGDEEDSE